MAAPPAGPPAMTTLASMGASPFASAASSGVPGLSQQLAGLAQNVVGLAFAHFTKSFLDVGTSSGMSTPPIRVLAPGNPPLTEEMLRRSTEVAAALYGTVFGAAERQRYGEIATAAWNRDLRAAIDAQLALIANYDAHCTGRLDRIQASRHLQSFLSACGIAAEARR